jgi:hypothetical protein
MYRFRSKSRRKLLFIKRGQLAKRVDSPLVENAEDVVNLSFSVFGGCGT